MKLEFEESLRGYVGAGASSREGYESGRRSGGSFGFQATASIEDLEAFEADPEHRAGLAGEVDWASIGRSPLLDGSELRLFVPRDGWRALVYRLTFASDRTRFELRGEKRLRRRPSLRQLTTLYVSLHQAEREQPVARGILRVPWADALRFGFHVRVPGRGLAGSLGPALRFLRFSRRQLLAPLPAPADARRVPDAEPAPADGDDRSLP